MLKHPLALAYIIAISTCLTQFDVTAAAIALPAIRAEFGLGLEGTAWVMDAYSLAFASMLLAAGALADRFGRQRSLVLGLGGFALASLLCGLAWDGLSLSSGRALQGAAAAFMVTGGLASLNAAYPDRTLRLRAFGVAGVVSGAAMALGPTFGGFISANIGWRWIFLVNLPVCAFAVIAVWRHVAESRDADGRPLDWLGIALLTVALIAPVQALLHHDGAVLLRWGAALGGLLLLIAFGMQQRRLTRPMLDPSVFATRGAIGVGSVLLLLSVGYWAVLIYLPLFLEAAYGLNSEQAGLAMLTATLPMLFLSPQGARLAQRFGFGQLFAGGLAMLGCGYAAMTYAAAANWPLIVMLLAMLLGSAGAGLINAQLSGALMAMTSPERAGMASALTVILRQGGYAVGIAVLGALAEPAKGSAAFTQSFGVAVGASLLAAILAFWLIGKTKA